MPYHRKPDWHLPESAATDEALFLNRRRLLASMGLGAAGFGLAMTGAGPLAALPAEARFAPMPGTNPAFADPGRPVTDEALSSTYNNFYEFGSSKTISARAQALPTEPWSVTIDGLVETPMQIDTDDLMARMGLEERVYRLRCVEAWSMVVPWVGFPLARLVALARPLSSARYVQFETFMMPDIAREQRAGWYPWPYTEGVTMAEATNDLSFMVVGAYGKVLHKQFGAPIRLHMPWKYGFKAIKSIVRISFTDQRPVGFWEELQRREYGFWANVNPAVDHPRWTQATELPLGQRDRIPTLLYNGYGEQVAHMYDGVEAVEGDRLWR